MKSKFQANKNEINGKRNINYSLDANSKSRNNKLNNFFIFD